MPRLKLLPVRGNDREADGSRHAQETGHSGVVDPEATRRGLLRRNGPVRGIWTCGSTVDAISEVAGPNERMHYHYFGSKEA
ncbi:hypothetical protein BURKHO8Y_480112 [Burkholderia sp. 8Y]|nr:hypothetical protein BURKHO8Y_480112 [Burkholderia sp. 8Y]